MQHVISILMRGEEKVKGERNVSFVMPNKIMKIIVSYPIIYPMILLAVIGLMAARRSKQFAKGKQIKTSWRRSIFRDRKLYSEYFNVYQNLRDKDREFHFKYVRMSKERFDHLLGLVRDNPLKIKQHWTLRPVRLLVKKVYSTVQHCCG